MNFLRRLYAKISNREQTIREGDYHLVDGNAWFRIKNLSVHINTTDEGYVVVNIYPLHDEMSESLGSTWVCFTEGPDHD